jgi:hypothetical protein
MSEILILELSEEIYAAIRLQAEAAGTSPADLVTASLERQFGVLRALRDGGLPQSEAEKQAARERFEAHFGEVDLGGPTGVDNESIDADLAREYADTHEEH